MKKNLCDLASWRDAKKENSRRGVPVKQMQKRFHWAGKGAKRMTENEIGKIVVDAAIAVHRALGPGLLETVYEIVLAHELSRRGLHVDRQVPVSIEYDGIRFDEGFRD